MIDAILKRRSIRRYTGHPVSQEQIRMLLDAAMAAPSGANLKPWHFVVVTKREKLDRLGDTTKAWAMLREAPLAIVVCGDPSVSEKYWDQDSIAAVENILLAASMIDLGAVWLGCHPDSERMAPVRSTLGIPEGVVPIAVLSIGHPAEEKESRTQYDGTRVHREAW